MGLRFCARAFSSCGKWGPLCIAVRGPLTVAASLVAEHRLQMRRLSSCGSRAQLLRGMWDLPRPGLKPVSPALAGGFSTTAPPGKPLISLGEKNLHILRETMLKSFLNYQPYLIFLLLVYSATLFSEAFVLPLIHTLTSEGWLGAPIPLLHQHQSPGRSIQGYQPGKAPVVPFHRSHLWPGVWKSCVQRAFFKN